MNSNLNLDQMGLESISLQEGLIIDGGSYASGEAAGQAAGAYLRNVLDGAGVLDALSTLGKALKWL